jgi:hypothetical protein
MIILGTRILVLTQFNDFVPNEEVWSSECGIRIIANFM